MLMYIVDLYMGRCSQICLKPNLLKKIYANLYGFVTLLLEHFINRHLWHATAHILSFNHIQYSAYKDNI